MRLFNSTGHDNAGSWARLLLLSSFPGLLTIRGWPCGAGGRGESCRDLDEKCWAHSPICHLLHTLKHLFLHDSVQALIMPASKTQLRSPSHYVVDFTVAELRQHFHLPLREAAFQLGTCEAVIKRVCRRHHIARWPYRQVSAKLIKIQQLSSFLIHIPADSPEAQRIRVRIQQLTDEYREAVGAPVPKPTKCPSPSPEPKTKKVRPASPIDTSILETFDCPEEEIVEWSSCPTAEEAKKPATATPSSFIYDKLSLRFILSGDEDDA